MDWPQNARLKCVGDPTDSPRCNGWNSTIGREQRRGLRQEAWERGKGCKDCILETFQRNLAGGKPAQESLTSNWKRVLRGERATGTAKRRQPAQKPCVSFESLYSREPWQFLFPGPRDLPEWSGKGVPPESWSMANGQARFPRNLGDPVVSTEEVPGRGSRVNNPRLAGGHTHRRRERNMRVPVVPPSEGNEARREGWQGVAVP